MIQRVGYRSTNHDRQAARRECVPAAEVQKGPRWHHLLVGRVHKCAPGVYKARRQRQSLEVRYIPFRSQRKLRARNTDRELTVSHTAGGVSLLGVEKRDATENTNRPGHSTINGQFDAAVTLPPIQAEDVGGRVRDAIRNVNLECAQPESDTAEIYLRSHFILFGLIWGENLVGNLLTTTHASADSVSKPFGMMRQGAGVTLMPRSQQGHAYLIRWC